MKRALIISFLFCFYFILPAEWIDIYKEGTIKLGIGSEKTLSQVQLNESDMGFTFAPDFSIFGVCQQRHKIFKYTDLEKEPLEFGGTGGENGCLLYPGSASILDEKYLVVGDYPHNQKLHLFDLHGNFKKKVELENPAYSLISLKNNRVAYTTWKRNFSREEEKRKEITVFIKNISTGNEIPVISCFVRDPGFINIAGKIRISLNDPFTGDVFIEKSLNGNLIVGLTTSPEIDIFSIDGTKIRTFALNINPIKVTEKFKKDFRATQIKRLMKKDYWEENEASIREGITTKELFDTYLPYYRYLSVDSQGNILIFKEKSSYYDEIIKFQVYTSEGEYICETVIETAKNFMLDIDNFRWFRKLLFTDMGIYYMLEKKGRKEYYLIIDKYDLTPPEFR
ncbi:hypothetical protein ACFLRB_03005 [Acidobacteriota bacterium]